MAWETPSFSSGKRKEEEPERSAEAPREKDPVVSYPCAVLSVHDARTKETDNAGSLLAMRLKAVGHEVVFYEMAQENAVAVLAGLESALASGAKAVFVTGGVWLTTSPSPLEEVVKRFEVSLPGFGEQFRSQRFEKRGLQAILSRAEAGLIGGKPVFMFGSSIEAVELAVNEIILPILPQLLHSLK